MVRLTTNARLAARAAMPETTWRENELLAWVKTRAVELGWHDPVGDRRKLRDDAAAYGVEVQPDPLPGLFFHHTFSLGSEAGWPDVTLVRRHDRRLLFAELKVEKGKLSPRQEEVLDLLRCLEMPPIEAHARHSEEQAFATFVNGLRGPRIEVRVWRPSDGEQILEVLR